MRERDYSFKCGHCNNEVIATLSIDSYGEPGTWEYPGSGADWSVIAAFCETCGRNYPDDLLEMQEGARIQEWLAEPLEDMPDA